MCCSLSFHILIIYRFLRHLIIPHIFEQQRWLNLYSIFPPVPAILIPEFYANMFDCNFLEKHFCVSIRGNTFYIDADIIANALEIPHVTKLDYTFENDPDKDVVLNRFCGYNCLWGNHTNAETVGFTDEVRLLNKIMCANLYPLSHSNTITLERAFFLYALLTNVPIDIPSMLLFS